MLLTQQAGYRGTAGQVPSGSRTAVVEHRTGPHRAAAGVGRSRAVGTARQRNQAAGVGGDQGELPS